MLDCIQFKYKIEKTCINMPEVFPCSIRVIDVARLDRRSFVRYASYMMLANMRVPRATSHLHISGTCGLLKPNVRRMGAAPLQVVANHQVVANQLVSSKDHSHMQLLKDTISTEWSKLLRRTAACFLGGILVLGSLNPCPAYAHNESVPLAQAWNVGSSVQAKPVFLESKEPSPSADDFSADELATIRLFQRNTPTVVNISNIVNAREPFSMNVMQLPQGQGSGFIWDQQGHIVTNFHVIRGASQLRVALIDQSVYPAKVIGGDPSKDIAVLQLEAPPEILRELKPVTLGRSDALFVGQKVFAIGNPFGLDHSLSAGLISGLNRELSAEGGPSLRNTIQTDASINPGNSGGVLLDSKGRVIGINTAIADPSGKGASSGIGFAIPIDTVKGLVDQILKYGRVIRPVLGITIAPPQALRQLGMQGVLVLSVPKDSPAFNAGMQGISRDSYGRLVIGDVIVGINGKSVRKEGDLFDVLDSCKVGDTVQVDVLRHGSEKKTFRVTLKERSIGVSE